jgi:NADP-dependent 3-hydroxy acid dehydrogenase YdfG
MAPTKVFLVTGANSGIGRKLATMEYTKVYMLFCRLVVFLGKSPNSHHSIGKSLQCHFVPFDCYAERSPSTSTAVELLHEDFVDGVLLNAGGWGRHR